MLQLPEVEVQAALRRTPRSPAQVAAGDAAKAAAFARLEFSIEDLVQMTSIAGTLVESYESEAISVGNLRCNAKQAIEQLKKTGDQLMFMVYEVEQKALALRDEWNEAAAAGDFSFNEPAGDERDDVDGDEAAGASERASAQSPLDLIDPSTGPLEAEPDLQCRLARLVTENNVSVVLGIYRGYVAAAEMFSHWQSHPYLDGDDFMELEFSRAWSKAYLVASALKGMKPDGPIRDSVAEALMSCALMMGHDLGDALSVARVFVHPASQDQAPRIPRR